MAESLCRLVDSYVVDIKRKSGTPPRKEDCRRVTKVASAGIVARAGIAPGDYFASLCGDPAAEFGDIQWNRCDDGSVEYGFYVPSRREHVLITAKKADAGFETEATPEAVVGAFARGEGDQYDLKILWEQGRWDQLKQVSGAVEFADRKKRTLADKLLGRRAPLDPKGYPTLLFFGSAIWELGDPETGWVFIEKYLEEFAPAWTTDFLGIGLYYAALTLEKEKNRLGAIDLMFEAWEKSDSPRIAKAFAMWAGRPPELNRAPSLGKAFPDRYEFPTLEGGRQTRLADALLALPERGLFGVCCLSSYRSNGPYNDLMGRWRNYGHYFGNWIRGMHVITANEYGDDAFLSSEKECINERIPVEVLLDEGNLLSSLLRLEASPHLYVLRKDGQVVHEGRLRSVQFWDMLAGVAT